MIKCGNCDLYHATVEEIAKCSAGEQVTGTPGEARSGGYKPDLTKRVSVACLIRACDNKSHEATVAELAGWRCPDHTMRKLPNLEERVLWGGKRYQVMEIGTDSTTVRLRTGGQGRIVPLGEISLIED